MRIFKVMKPAFTLIELLIVISIIAILAATIIPNFVGFDAEARISATKANLDTLRTCITLFRVKEGRYPESLEELIKTYYYDAGVKKSYIKKIPPEFISNKSGNTTFVDTLSTDEFLVKDGGWVYFKDIAEVHVNLDEPLNKKWGKYSGEKPIEW